MRQLEEALRREATMRIEVDDTRRLNAMLRSEIYELQQVILLRPRLTEEERRHIHDRRFLEMLTELAQIWEVK